MKNTKADSYAKGKAIQGKSITDVLMEFKARKNPLLRGPILKEEVKIYEEKIC